MDLSDLLLCTKSNTSRIVQGMLKDGLLTRLNHPDDRRSYKLYLSEKGKHFINVCDPFINNK